MLMCSTTAEEKALDGTPSIDLVFEQIWIDNCLAPLATTATAASRKKCATQWPGKSLGWKAPAEPSPQKAPATSRSPRQLKSATLHLAHESGGLPLQMIRDKLSPPVVAGCER